MKRISVVFMMLVLAMVCTVFAAQPAAAAGASGMQMHHMRHMRVPPAKGAMLNIANEIVDAINKQDAAELDSLLAPDAVYLDEDGHAPPARAWAHKLTTGTPPKHITISSTHSQMWGDSGWVSFNYTLTEDYHGQPKNLVGTASIVCRKTDGKWKIQLVHGALKQTVAGITQ